MRRALLLVLMLVLVMWVTKVLLEMKQILADSCGQAESLGLVGLCLALAVLALARASGACRVASGKSVFDIGH